MLLSYKAVLCIAGRRYERVIASASSAQALEVATRIAERMGGDFTAVLACEPVVDGGSP